MSIVAGGLPMLLPAAAAQAAADQQGLVCKKGHQLTQFQTTLESGRWWCDVCKGDHLPPWNIYVWMQNMQL